MSKLRKIVKVAKKVAEDMDSPATRVAPPGPDSPGWINQVAMITGALAALTGFLTVYSTRLSNQAIYESNQAILAQTQASDAWGEYQADSVKAHIIEMQLLPSSPISSDDKAGLRKMDQEIRGRQASIRQAALDKTAERQSHLTNGTSYLAAKDMLNYASMAAQLGIALASVAALTRRRAVFWGSVLIAGISAAITVYSIILNALHGS